MSLEAQISLMTVPQEFCRLCNAILRAEHGDDFLPIDDDQADAGNDGYLKSERRMFAMHCFKRPQNQGVEQAIRRKMIGDLGKAIALKDTGEWAIEAWTFVSNYPISERVASDVLRMGEDAGMDVSWRGPTDLAVQLQRLPEVRARFPDLQANEVSDRLAEVHAGVVGLAKEVAGGVPAAFSGIPRNPDEQVQLVATKPDFWEHLLFAGALIQGQEALEFEYLDHKMELTVRREPVDFHTAIEVMQASNEAVSAALDRVIRVFDESALEYAFGPPGEHGDPKAIQHLALIVIGFYEELLRSGAELRSVVPPRILARAWELSVRRLDAPIAQVRDFIDRTVDEFEHLPDYLEHDEPVTITLDLTLAMDEELVDQFEEEMRRVKWGLRWRRWLGVDINT